MTKRTLLTAVTFLTSLLLATACEDGVTDAAAPCTAGQSMACEVVAGCFGQTICGQDGSFGACQVNPEICGNGADDNCNGQIDDGCDNGTDPCTVGQSMACEVVPGCFGQMICGLDGSFGACQVNAEICGNGVDDNCNGQIDEGCGTDPNPGDEDCTVVDATEACLTTCSTVGTKKCGANKKWSQCVPPAEECNGKDDNCNGVPDDGLTRECSTNCGKGTETCANGVWAACTAPQPEEEVCDGKDNDCDGTTDLAANGTALEMACQGACGLGSSQCYNGVPGPCSADGTAEVCNGKDDDCNGTVDDAPGGCDCTAGQTQLCGSDVGECSQGVQECLSGQWSACKTGMHQSKLWTYNEGIAEKCDLLDNDCDGDTDEGNPDGGGLCGTQPGVGGITAPCALGSTQCQGGELICFGGVDPEPEVCDGMDNDCDGEIDEENQADNYENNNSCQSGTYETVTQGAGKKVLTLNLYPADDFDWFEIKAKELADFCLSDDSEGPYQFTVKMTPPDGLDYDLCVWPAETNSCGDLPQGGGPSGNCDDLGIFVIGSGSETYTYPPEGGACWDGGCGDNDDRTFYIKVYSYVSTDEDCAPYTLELEMTEVSADACDSGGEPTDVCGNGVCESSESEASCPADCTPVDECDEVCAATCSSAGDSCVESCSAGCLQDCAEEYSACNTDCAGVPPCLANCSSANEVCEEDCTCCNSTCELGCDLTESSCISGCGC